MPTYVRAYGLLSDELEHHGVIDGVLYGVLYGVFVLSKQLCGGMLRLRRQIPHEWGGVF